jgi:hypothetical protein
MANYYIMPKAQVVGWDSQNKLPTPDIVSYRAAHEGHGSEKALRVHMFEDSATTNPTVVHTYQSDNYLRMKTIYENGTLEVGDTFIFGIVDSLAELDFLAVEQINTVPGFQIQLTALDQNFAVVEAEGISIDFTNAKTGNRWDTQPVQKYNYDESGDNAVAGRGEYFYLAGVVEALPEEWFSDCDNSCLPEFTAHLRYEDLCLPYRMEGCAPQDVIDAYDAALADFTDDIVLWQDIAIVKGGGWSDGCSTPAPATTTTTEATTTSIG